MTYCISQEQLDALINDLLLFVHRVSANKNADMEELALMLKASELLLQKMEVRIFAPLTEDQQRL